MKCAVLEQCSEKYSAGAKKGKVIKIKWGLILGFAVLFISVILGIISGVQPFYIFIRALIFTIIFFGLGVGLSILISNFFPELLLKEEEPAVEEEQPGSRVNITLENTGEYAVPEMYKSQDGSQELGNIEELMSGKFKPRRTRGGSSEGIDRKREDDYNSNGSAFKKDDNMDSQSSGKPVFTPMFGGDSEGLTGLPDLDSMAMAFSSGGESSFRSGGNSGGSSGAGSEPAMAYSPDADSESESLQMQSFDDVGKAPVKSKNKGDGSALQGDFSPQEIALGIRTVLDKDK